jgi:site-specific recombinase XerD
MASRALLSTQSRSLTVLSQRARDYARKAKSSNTLRGYAAALKDFCEFCRDHNLEPLPASPTAVVAYITTVADLGLKVSTINVRLAAIAEAHRMKHLTDPTIDEDVRLVMAGIRHDKKTRPTKKSPADLEVIHAFVSALPDDLTGVRDRAVLLLGFGGMMRRSEIVALNVEDVTIEGKHMQVLVKQSKADQAGEGLIKHYDLLRDVALCPVRAVQAWIKQSGIQSGPLFRPIDRWAKLRNSRLTDQSVALIIKHAARRAGLDESKFSGHSLRRGGITSAIKHDAKEIDTMQQSGHKDVKTFRGYIEDAGQGATRAQRAAFGESDDQPGKST